MPAQIARIVGALLAGAATAFWVFQPSSAAKDCSQCPTFDNPLGISVLAMPMMLAVVPLLARPPRARRNATLVAAVMLTVVAILEPFIVGWVDLPSALALWVAVAVGGREASGVGTA